MERKYHPTARSPELLVAILSFYPIFRSLVSVSHRSDTINLAQTSKDVQRVLAFPGPRRPAQFESCHDLIGSLSAVVCRYCVVTTYEPDERGPRWGDRESIWVGGGRTGAMRR